MDTFQLLISGFAAALQPGNLLFAFIGCLLGTLVGVVPGIGPLSAIAMLIPVTFVLDPTPAIIMLAAIYYGSMYGGTITSVLVNVPGEAASAITCIDGYQMARQGRAGAALSVAAVGSFFGGTVATMGLVLIALPLTALGLKFGPPEFFALMAMGLSMVTGLAGKSIARSVIAAGFGLLVGMVGMDPIVGAPRFVFDQVQLMDGFQFGPVVMGLFGISEILLNAESFAGVVFDTRVSRLIPTRRDLRDSVWPVLRGTGVGFVVGIIPGAGGIISTFLSYAVEKRLSKTPEKFGTGMIEGVAGPETANNACANAALIPLFTLGVPGSGSAALIMGALMMHGLVPGPFLFKDHADFVWTVIASLYVGNVMLLILNLPLIPLWVAVLRIPYSILFSIVLGLMVVGSYSLAGSVFDVGAMLAFGVVGYIFKKLDVPLTPFVLTLILGPLMEQGLRRSLTFSRGDFGVFFTSPISAGLLAIAGLFLVGPTLRPFVSAWRSGHRGGATNRY